MQYLVTIASKIGARKSHKFTPENFALALGDIDIKLKKRNYNMHHVISS